MCWEKKFSRYLKANFWSGNITCSGLTCKKGHQTDASFYITTGSVTQYLTEMSKYGKTKGQ